MKPNSLPRPLLLSLVALAVTGCGAVEKPPDHNVRMVRNEHTSATLPYQVRGGRITVEVRINQSGPLHLVLDTGAPITAIFESDRTTGFDQPISSPSASPISHHTASMSGASMELVNGLTLTVGNVTLEALQVWQWPADRFFGRQDYDDVPYDGVIGYDLLRFVALEINRSNQTITLRDSEADTPSGAWSWSPLEFKNNKPFCEVLIQVEPEADPVSLTLHLDTGNAGPIWLKTDDTKGIRLPETNPIAPVGQWLDGSPILGVGWPSHELQVFGHRLWGQPTRFVPSGHPLHPDREGHIGEQELRHFDLIIDYPGNRIAARPIRRPVSIAPEDLALYAGEFSSDELPLTFTFSVRGGLLYVQATGQNPLPLIPASRHEFRFEPVGISFTYPENKSGVLDYDSITLRQNGRTFQLRRTP